MSDLRKAAEMALEALDSYPLPFQVPAKEALRQALAQPEQESFIVDRGCFERGCACYDDRVDKDGIEVIKKEWVGLPNDEEILEISKDAWGRSKLKYGKDDHRPFYIAFARAIEAKLKEKNT